MEKSKESHWKFKLPPWQSILPWISISYNYFAPRSFSHLTKSSSSCPHLLSSQSLSFYTTHLSSCLLKSLFSVSLSLITLCHSPLSSFLFIHLSYFPSSNLWSPAFLFPFPTFIPLIPLHPPFLSITLISSSTIPLSTALCLDMEKPACCSGNNANQPQKTNYQRAPIKVGPVLFNDFILSDFWILYSISISVSLSLSLFLSRYRSNIHLVVSFQQL